MVKNIFNITYPGLESVIKVNKIIIGIPSIIYVNPNRSIIPIKERYSQTILQLKSLRNLSNTTIVLLELSRFIPEDILNELSILCDYVITFKDDKLGEYYVYNNPYKGYGETYSLIRLYEIIKDKEFSHFIKLGGRYSLSNNFNINDFIRDKPTYLLCDKNTTSKLCGFISNTPFCLQSLIFSIPRKYYESYYRYFVITLNDEHIIGVEEHLTLFCLKVKEYYLLEIANIIGSGSLSNEEILW